MGRRGPRPTPTSLLIRRGSPVAAKRMATNRTNRRKGFGLRPLPPAWMSEDGAEKFREVVSLLRDRGDLSLEHVDVIADYAEAWVTAVAMLRAARSDGRDPGMDYDRAARRVERLQRELCLTPRSRVQNATTEESPPDGKARFFEAG